MRDEVKEILTNIRRAISAEKLQECQVVTWEDIVDINIPVIPLPSARINAALGCGGLPCGRITEIFGPEAGGKTTLALHAVASAQAVGKTAAFIDMEHALDAGYAGALGVDMNNLIVSQPDTGDDAMHLCKIFVENGVDIIVVDSVAALVSRAELEKGITDSNIGLQARMMSQGLRQLTPSVSKSDAVLLFTNQVRDKISFMGGETTPGGRALKFSASVRIRIARISPGKETKEERQTSRIKIVKNKVGTPFRECDVDILYGKGIDGVMDTIKFAKELKIITGTSYMILPKLKCEGLKDDMDNDMPIKLQGFEAIRNFVLDTKGYLNALKLKTEEMYEQSRK